MVRHDKKIKVCIKQIADAKAGIYAGFSAEENENFINVMTKEIELHEESKAEYLAIALILSSISRTDDCRTARDETLYYVAQYQYFIENVDERELFGTGKFNNRPRNYKSSYL